MKLNEIYGEKICKWLMENSKNVFSLLSKVPYNSFRGIWRNEIKKNPDILIDMAFGC